MVAQEPASDKERKSPGEKIFHFQKKQWCVCALKMVQQEVRKGPWTEQEDFKLVSFVGLFGDRRWDFIAKVSGLKVAGDSKKQALGIMEEAPQL